MTYRILYEGQMAWPWRVQTETIYGDKRIVGSFQTKEDAQRYIDTMPVWP